MNRTHDTTDLGFDSELGFLKKTMVPPSMTPNSIRDTTLDGFWNKGGENGSSVVVLQCSARAIILVPNYVEHRVLF